MAKKKPETFVFGDIPEIAKAEEAREIERRKANAKAHIDAQDEGVRLIRGDILIGLAEYESERDQIERKKKEIAKPDTKQKKDKRSSK
jgi:hypothetical protein